MFQEENPGDCEALTHISPQCVIFAPAAEGWERARSCSTPPALPRPFPGSGDWPKAAISAGGAGLGARGGAGGPGLARGQAAAARPGPEPAFRGLTCHWKRNWLLVQTSGTCAGLPPNTTNVSACPGTPGFSICRLRYKFWGRNGPNAEKYPNLSKNTQ